LAKDQPLLIIINPLIITNFCHNATRLVENIPSLLGAIICTGSRSHPWEQKVTINSLYCQVDHFLANEAKGTKIVGAHSLEEMVAKLKKPRRVMLLVKAGSAVDAFVDKLVPLLDEGDIIIDGGNSEYQDTRRRTADLEKKGILYVGSGVSGGEEGARYGIVEQHPRVLTRMTFSLV